MDLFQDKWLDDVSKKWIIDTDMRDEFVHCYYILEYNGKYNFKYIEALFKYEDNPDEIYSVEIRENFDFGFNTLSKCCIVENEDTLDSLNSLAAKVVLYD